MTTSKWYTPSGRSIQRPFRMQEERDPDEDVTRNDSTAAADSVFRTDRGRSVRGGGGVAPDLVVKTDSLELVARNRLQQALGRNVVKYTDALAAFALEARARQSVPSPTFTVTPAMRAQFLGLLQQRGVTIDQATLQATWPFIEKQLGGQTARFAFGRGGEVMRLSSGDDPVLTSAKRLAARATSPVDLLTLVAAAAPPQVARP
jgi:carboxyl-terminal processing protease